MKAANQVSALFLSLPIAERDPVRQYENQGLGVAVMNSLRRVCFGLTADWDLVPDLPVFARAIDSSFAELSAAAERVRP